MQQAAFSSIETWSRLRHPNIVSVHEAFTTRAFNDSCMPSCCRSTVPFSLCACLIALVVVYEDHPDAQTIHEAHIKVKPPQFQHGRLQAQSNNRVPERTIWSYIIQIANALRATHDAGLAVRLIDATKILVTGKNRYVAGPVSSTAQALIGQTYTSGCDWARAASSTC